MVKYNKDKTVIYIESSWDLEQEMCKYNCTTVEELKKHFSSTYNKTIVLKFKEDET